jgi:hypothetical protein
MAITLDQVRAIRFSIESTSANDLVIAHEHCDDFWLWFQENATHFANVTHPMSDNDFIACGCFTNSYRSGRDYFEGFYELNYDYIYHGFNVESEMVSDYTIRPDAENYIRMNNRLPSNYYGVEIPISFVQERYPSRTGDIVQPGLIYEYFLFCRI